MANFEKAQKIVGLNEGGYQCDPSDEGNYYKGHLIGTNWGISAPTLASFLGHIPTKAEMVNLSRQVAESILKANYWAKNNLELLTNQSIANIVYDGVVNHGNSGMRLLMEKAMRKLYKHLSYYEAFTKNGIKALNKVNQKDLFNAIFASRRESYQASPKKQYIKAWLRRLDKFKYYPNNSISGIWPITALGVVGLGIILILM